MNEQKPNEDEAMNQFFFMKYYYYRFSRRENRISKHRKSEKKKYQIRISRSFVAKQKKTHTLLLLIHNFKLVFDTHKLDVSNFGNAKPIVRSPFEQRGKRRI